MDPTGASVVVGVDLGVVTSTPHVCVQQVYPLFSTLTYRACLGDGKRARLYRVWT